MAKHLQPGRRAQSAFEITIITGIMLLIFSTFFVIITSQGVMTRKQQDLQLLQDLAQVILAEMEMAAQAEDGYMRTFTIPERVADINFSINFITEPSNTNHTEVVIIALNRPEGYEVIEIAPLGIRGTNLFKGPNNITKNSGYVCVNQDVCP